MTPARCFPVSLVLILFCYMVAHRKDLYIDPLYLALEHERLTVFLLDRIEVYIRAFAREVVGAEHCKANIQCTLIVDRRNAPNFATHLQFALAFPVWKFQEHTSGFPAKARGASAKADTPLCGSCAF